MDPQIGQGFNQDIATRYKPGQTEAEFYSQKTGETFGDPTKLAGYVNTNYVGSNATPDNVFGVLAGGYTPRDQALGGIKDDLNNFQKNLYDQGTEPGKRASSSLTENIDSSRAELDKYLADYAGLKKKLDAIATPNYLQTYDQLRDTSGARGFENDYANLSAQRRELPYREQANSGNAGTMTQGQVNDQTAQKDIPLYIQQANALDRLKLAQDFINNSVNLKKLDQDASHQSLSEAGALLGNLINFSTTNLTNLTAQHDKELERQGTAQKFAFENRIGKPFYEIGGTVYRTSDGKPASSPEEYVKMGGTGDFSDTQKVEAPKFNKDNIIGNEALGYFSIDPITGKKTKILEGTGNVNFSKVGVDANGNDTYGFVDSANKTITPVGSGGISIPSGTLAAKNNNPGNLRYVGQAGASQGTGGFAKFESPEAGFQALVSQIQLDAGRGQTLSQFINKYAPPSENNTSQYLQQAVAALGVSANTPINKIDVNSLAQFMAKKESGTTINGASTQNNTETVLKSSAGNDGFVNPQVYVDTRSKTKMSPDEFDKRYGYLLSPKEQKKMNIAGGTTANDLFLTPDYFKGIYNKDTLLKQTGKSFGFLTKDKDTKVNQAIDDYLNNLMKTVQAYREAGFTDQDILKMMQK